MGFGGGGGDGVHAGAAITNVAILSVTARECITVDNPHQINVDELITVGTQVYCKVPI